MIVVNFEYGIDLTPTAYKNIYVIWIEEKTSGFIQNINVCQKLVTGGLTGTVLPYWTINKYPVSSESEIDSVYELLPAGRTPNENTQNLIQSTPMGQLQGEMRYITNFNEGSEFGAADPRSATKMVLKITASIERSVTAQFFTVKP
jgi:hypothetical protein